MFLLNDFLNDLLLETNKIYLLISIDPLCSLKEQRILVNSLPSQKVTREGTK